MLAVILNQADLPAGCAQAFQQGEAMLILAIEAMEAKLTDRRVMVFGCRADLPFWEELGYGRCKNAWTYFRPGFEERDFLPGGYQYENEFLAEKRIGKTEPRNTVIT